MNILNESKNKLLHHQFIGNSSSNNLIIFLHEGLGSIEMWKKFPQQLVNELGCYGLIYDRSGYGKSPGSLKNRSVDYLHEAAQELNAFIKKLNFNNYNVSLYGHSDGGSIALIFASTYSGKIHSIITEAAHAFVEDETLKGVKDAIQPFQEGKFNGLAKYHGDRFEEVFWAWNNIWLSPEFKTWNILNEMANIKVPALIIQGLNDQYGTPKQIS